MAIKLPELIMLDTIFKSCRLQFSYNHLLIYIHIIAEFINEE